MDEKQNPPRWWQLYLLGAGTAGLLTAAASARLTATAQDEAAAGIVVLVCGLVYLWLRANARALRNADRLTLVRETDRDWATESQAQFTAVLVSPREPDPPTEPVPAASRPAAQEVTR